MKRVLKSMKRDKRFELRVSEAELREIKELASLNGIPVAEYIRLKSLGKKVKKAS